MGDWGQGVRYKLYCVSKWKAKDIIEKYPVVNNYNPIVDYPYPNLQAERLTIEVEDLIKFYDDIGEEIIISKDYCNNDGMYSLKIYDDYRE